MSGRNASEYAVISGIVVNTLAFGLIVSRFLKPTPGLILSQKLAYDHRHTRNLNFRIRNQSADEYVNVMINANLVRRVEMDVPPYDAYHSFPLDLHIIKPAVFTPNMVLYIETISQNVEPLKPLELQENSNEFAVLRMEPDDEIEISVNAISSTRGDHIEVGRSYRIKDIICGTFNSLRPYKIENDRGPIEFGNFGKIQKTDKNTCNDCELLEKCPLVLAIKCRKSKNLGAYEIKSS